MQDFMETHIPGVLDFLASQVLPAGVILAAGIWTIRVLLRILGNILDRSKLEKAAHSLILSVVKAVGYVLLALIVASRLGVDVSGIIALASVLTLAVSLAVENALANVFGGFTLLYTQPFHSGDLVEIAGQIGLVKEIGLAYTQLVTGDNKTISIPNSAVTSAQIVNYSVNGTRRYEVRVKAAYDVPVELVLEALTQAARSVPAVLEDPAPFAAVAAYGDSGVEYLLHVWFTAEDFWVNSFRVNTCVKEAFDKRGIAMAYPHLNVHMER